MKKALLILLIISAHQIFAQNKNTIFYDSLDQITTWEGHWAQVVTGKYKSVYNKSENKKTLARVSQEEFEAELRKTEKRIIETSKIGTAFPDFNLIDLNGKPVTISQLRGKIIVLNFWFIGCAPCEMERPALNDLTKIYSNNEEVVFLAFARNEKEQLSKFLQDNPVHYNVVPTDKDYIKATFGINDYPTNIIVDRNGRYFFNSAGTGIGIHTILQKHINEALRMK